MVEEAFREVACGVSEGESKELMSILSVEISEFVVLNMMVWRRRPPLVQLE